VTHLTNGTKCDLEDASQYLELALNRGLIYAVTDLTYDSQDDLEDGSKFLELALSKGLIQ
jgi:hypothetical protein